MNILPSNLIIASRMVASRLTKPHNIGSSVLEPSIADSSAVQHHLGHFVGYFKLLEPTIPYFALYCRPMTHIIGPISHVIIIFINQEYKKLPDAVNREITRFGGNEVTCDTKRGLALVLTDEFIISHLSILIEASESAFHPNIIDNYVPRRVVKAPERFPILSHDRDDMRILLPCEEHRQCPETQGQHILALRSRGYKFLSYDVDNPPSDIPKDFDVIKIRLSDHFIYAVNYPSSGAIFFLFPHTAFGVGHYTKIHDQFKWKFGDKILLGCKFHSSRLISCNDVMLLQACILMILFEPHTLTFIRESDIIALRPQIDEFLASKVPRSHHPDDTGLGSQQSSLDVTADYVLNWRLGLTTIPGRHLRPTSTSSFDYESISTIGSDLVKVRRRFEAIDKAEVPPIPRGSYPGRADQLLNNLDIFRSSFQHIHDDWDRYATCQIKTPIHLGQLDHLRGLKLDETRFTVVPIVDRGIGLYAMIIFDREPLEFIFFNADFDEQRTKQLFSMVTEITDTYWNQYCGRIVKLTSFFHRKYHVVHLVFGLWTVSRLMRYAVMLPKRIIYSEYHFRLYCFLTLYEKQLSNHEYNISRDLVNTHGDLLLGARSINVSLVQYERIVVPTDTCMFCKKRGFQNLGRHMVMQHGGQARAAYYSRQDVDRPQ